jgi:DNA-binding MarR family transcriptional regulator
LLTRAASDDDRRVAFVAATAEGRALVESIRRRRDAYLAERLRTFTPDELAVLERAAPLLERLLEEPSP